MVINMRLRVHYLLYDNVFDDVVKIQCSTTKNDTLIIDYLSNEGNLVRTEIKYYEFEVTF